MWDNGVYMSLIKSLLVIIWWTLMSIGSKTQNFQIYYPKTSRRPTVNQRNDYDLMLQHSASPVTQKFPC